MLSALFITVLHLLLMAFCLLMSLEIDSITKRIFVGLGLGSMLFQIDNLGFMRCLFTTEEVVLFWERFERRRIVQENHRSFGNEEV